MSGDVVVERAGLQSRIEPVHVVSTLPRNDYLSMQTKLARDAGSGAVLAAKAKHAAYAATLELRWPGILDRCVWENILQSGDVTHIAKDGPMRFRAPIARLIDSCISSLLWRCSPP